MCAAINIQEIGLVAGGSAIGIELYGFTEGDEITLDFYNDRRDDSPLAKEGRVVVATATSHVEEDRGAVDVVVKCQIRPTELNAAPATRNGPDLNAKVSFSEHALAERVAVCATGECGEEDDARSPHGGQRHISWACQIAAMRLERGGSACRSTPSASTTRCPSA